MTIYLKQSTASQEVPLGYFVDSSDGNTEETGLTIANTDIKLWKAGATTLANKNSGGATHISNGIYYAVLDATDTDTLGSLVIFVHVAGALPVRLECVVLAANVYDSIIGGGDILDTNTAAINESTAAAEQLAKSAAVIVSGAAAAGTLSTTQMTTNLTEATNDHYNGRIVIWTSGALLGQATAITDYDGATKKITYTAVTEAPSAADTFVIV